MDHYFFANAAVSLFAHLYIMVPLVWIVILVETAFIQNAAEGSAIRAFASSTVANLTSTFIGIPITWFLTFFLSIPLFGVAVILDQLFSQYNSNFGTVLNLMFGGVHLPGSPGYVEMLATIFLLIPYYYMSVAVEYFLVRLFYAKIEPERIKKAVARMNRTTYLILGGLMLAIFVIGEYLPKK